MPLLKPAPRARSPTLLGITFRCSPNPLIAERTRDGMNTARAKGSRPGRPPLNPEKLEATLLLVKGGMSPTKTARRTALGRSTLYREIQAGDHA